MDGYSVEEAADVLGIPHARVWELIARGVLAGASEAGGSMRVYLKPLAASPARVEDEPTSGDRNGHGTRRGNGEAHELSPFRELLTEFRNLTERYGQALLALGEARGEVASLRSRVDLLEARMDARVPVRQPSTIAWEMPGWPTQPPAEPTQRHPEQPMEQPAREPQPTERASEAMPNPDVASPMEASSDEEGAASGPPPVEAATVDTPASEDHSGLAGADDEAGGPDSPDVTFEEAADPEPEGHRVDAAAPTDAVEGSEPPRRKMTGGRAAVAGLAEALLRAEDPALAGLPGAKEAADALAALHRDVAAAREVAEPGPAEAGTVEPSEAAYAPAMELEEAAVEPGPHFEAEAEVEPERPFEAESDEVPAAETDAHAGGEPPAFLVGSRYTAEVIEPDWFADGDFAWLQGPEPESPDEPPTVPIDQPADEPAEAPDEAIQEAFDEPPLDEPRPEETRLDDFASELAGPDEDGGDEPAGSSQEPFDAGFDQPAEEPGPARPAAEDEPPAPRARAIAISSHDEDRQSAETDPEALRPAGIVGFGLYRGQLERVVERPSLPRPSSSVARDEEALMWFGDQFEESDLEVAAPGWRPGERSRDPIPAEPAVLRLSDTEIDQLASTEGWDRDEVAALRGLLGKPAAASPGGDEPANQEPAGTEPAAPQSKDAQPARREPVVDPGHQDWARSRRGPAAVAYRRLRRLFQG